MALRYMDVSPKSSGFRIQVSASRMFALIETDGGKHKLSWFRTFAMNVSQIYDTDDAPVEMKIELEKRDDQLKPRV